MNWHSLAAAAATFAMRYDYQFPERRRREPVVAGTPNEMAMDMAPIEPSWVIAGNPVARAATHSSAEDKCATTAVWDCTAGQFRWYFGWDETVVILEGEVHVTGEDGSTRVLRQGDLAYFKGGTWATWRIDNYVRKIAVTRKPFPLMLSLYYRILARLLPQQRAGLPQ